MGEKMTLEQVRDRCISWLGDVACNGSVSGVAAADIRAIFEPHLATPAQTVDVEAVKSVIERLRSMHKFSPMSSFTRAELGKEIDKLSQAIGDKAS